VNVSQATLVFHMSAKNVIRGFENITLVDEEHEEFFSNTTLNLEAIEAARVVVTSEILLGLNETLNYTYEINS